MAGESAGLGRSQSPASSRVPSSILMATATDYMRGRSCRTTCTFLTILPEHPLGPIVSSWKRFTARKANQQLGRSGAFWQTEYWDRFVRNGTHFSAAQDYIDNNPVKAGLVSEPKLWPYGSARLKA